MPASSIFTYIFTVPETSIDENGHVNNVAYVQWMQEAAVRHYASIGGTDPMHEAGATWVVYEHRIKYLLPAYAGELIEVRTWVANIRKVRSLRRYEFVRKKDGGILVSGETDWVFVNTRTGLPIQIPDSVVGVFTLLPDK
jgi:acyl-CoA thioester hydrolase